jgi:predicted phage baseplate assembly protein
MKDECGCCEGISQETPARVSNPPGLSRIACRVGTHARFLESMLAGLTGSAAGPLTGLRTRDTQDPTVAFLDACATVDDVLTFYQERFANETYLATSTERLSLVQLARQVGREPRPGVAAETYLSFTVEDTPGSPESTVINAGTRVQSIPGPGELPQTYETAHTITARSSWNSMAARDTKPQPIGIAMTSLVVSGIDLGIRRGDRVLVIAGSAASARGVLIVRGVQQNAEARTTTLTLGEIAPSGSTLFVPGILYRPLSNLTPGLSYTSRSYSESALNVYGRTFNVGLRFFTSLFNVPPVEAEAGDVGVYVFRQRAAVFGHNAPQWATLPQVVLDKQGLIPGKHIASEDLEKAQYGNNWDNYSIRQSTGADRVVDLDNVYGQVTPGGWIALESAAGVNVYHVDAASELSRSDFAMSAKVSRVSVDTTNGLASHKMRGTAAHVQSERLTLARMPVTQAVHGNSVVLAQYYPGLQAGQAIVLTGRREDLPSLTVSESRKLTAVAIDGTIEPDAGRVFTSLTLDAPLTNRYLPSSVRVNANTVLATHGESKAEVLGGGDASRRYQTFTLKQPPLTYTSAPTPTGGQSSLQVRISDLLWQEAEMLFGLRPDERKYVVRVDDDGATRVVFNAALPSGTENVKAAYRSGIGLAGRVKADQLTLLSTRPLGVRGVTNPLPSAGGEDPEGAESLRRSASLHGLTLGRLVSLRDYEDFARAFSGFAKAHATVTSDGERQELFVTVAPASGAAILETSETFGNLRSAMTQYGDPRVALTVRAWRPAFFQIAARAGVAGDRDLEIVSAAIQAKVRETFSFDRRSFGQDVVASEVIAAIQAVPGVVFVELRALWKTNPLEADLAAPAPPVATRLVADAPVPGTVTTDARPAELLMLDPRPVALVVTRA